MHEQNVVTVTVDNVKIWLTYESFLDSSHKNNPVQNAFANALAISIK